MEEAVSVSIESLVHLNRSAASLSLHPGRFLSQKSGDYVLPFKGHGMEFDEARPYQAGDEIRHIDWRVTARTGKAHTKLFREERERPVFLWVDYRAPMFFATRGVYKSVIAAKAASLLAWRGIHDGDRIGGIIFSEDVHHELKPSSGKSAVLHLIKQLVYHPAWNKTDLTTQDPQAIIHALMCLHRVARPGSLIFLLSDFRRMDKAAESYLTRLSRNNDIVMMFIYDALEKQLPPMGQYGISDGRALLRINTRNKKLTEDHELRFFSRESHLKKLAQRYGMHFLSCTTMDDPLKILQAGLRFRSR